MQKEGGAEVGYALLLGYVMAAYISYIFIY